MKALFEDAITSIHTFITYQRFRLAFCCVPPTRDLRGGYLVENDEICRDL